MVFLDLAFQPNDKVSDQVSLNIFANVASKRPLELTYGVRFYPRLFIRG